MSPSTVINIEVPVFFDDAPDAKPQIRRQEAFNAAARAVVEYSGIKKAVQISFEVDITKAEFHPDPHGVIMAVVQVRIFASTSLILRIREGYQRRQH